MLCERAASKATKALAVRACADIGIRPHVSLLHEDFETLKSKSVNVVREVDTDASPHLFSQKNTKMDLNDNSCKLWLMGK